MNLEVFNRPKNIIPKKILRESKGFEERIGQIFTDLVRSITNRYPKLVRDHRSTVPTLDLTEFEKKSIGCLNRSTNPEELVKIIFEIPPAVYATMNENEENTRIPLRPPHKITVIPSDQSDIELGKTKIKTPGYLLDEPQGTEGFSLLINSLQNYLKAPKIVDGFSEKDINRRGLWALGISTVLHQLTIDKSNMRFFNKKKRYDWDGYFNIEVWNNNRYASAKRSAVYMNYYLFKMLPFPAEIKNQMEFLVVELEKTKPVFDSGQIDLAIDQIANIARKTLKIFLP